MEGRDPECPIELGGRTREIITARSPAAPQPRAAFCLSRLWLPSCGRQGPSSPPRAFCPREAFRAVWGGEVCRTVSSSALCTINAPLSEHQHRRGEMRWEQGSSVLINIEETTNPRASFSCWNALESTPKSLQRLGVGGPRLSRLLLQDPVSWVAGG